MRMRNNPNPNSFSFDLSGEVLHQIQSAVIRQENAEYSGLAQAIFSNIENVFEVFIKKDIKSDFITITKSRGIWNDVEKAQAKALIDHLVADNQSIIDETKYIRKVPGLNSAIFDAFQIPEYEPKDDLEVEIKDFFDKDVDELAAQDGGNISLYSIVSRFEGDVEKFDISMVPTGACNGCKASSIKTEFNIKKGLNVLFKSISEQNDINVSLGELIVVDPATLISPTPL